MSGMSITKKKKNYKGLVSVFIFAFILCIAACASTGHPAYAQVSSTSEAAGGADTVYVAGNPDWYPIEYYNPDTESFEGLLPELLGHVSENTGLDFTYIQAGKEDQRAHLAENGRVEMISGIAQDSPWLKDYDLTLSATAFSLLDEKEPVNVCFAFTKAADEQLAEKVNGALSELSQDDTAGIAIRFMLSHTQNSAPKGLVEVCVGLAVIMVLVVAVLFVKMRKYRKAVKQNEDFDPVTGIGNKHHFLKQFKSVIPDRCRRMYFVAFIAFDIVHVNQYYGEKASEEQLRFAANELISAASDSNIIARVSGGGFAVAKPCDGEGDIRSWAEYMLARLNKYAEKYEKDYHPEFRMGIYMLRSGDRDGAIALFNAQQGYQRAVEDDLPYAFSRTEELKRESEALQLRKQTLHAIHNSEFNMFLQFIVRCSDGRISGAEALSRWNHPQKGLLFPGSYVNLMESEKTIAELDFYIFEKACQQLERWRKQDIPITISCNFTRMTIDREDFISNFQEIVKRYDFKRARLVLEITEDSMEENKEIAFENISRCKEMGFRIALDDAGCGYTSFSDLRDYPIDVVKIDRSILTAAVNRRGIALLKGMISLIHSLEMEVLCEGVETEAQADMLCGLGCDYMQGYYFYQALPCEEAENILQAEIARQRAHV